MGIEKQVDLYVYPTNVRFIMPDNVTLENGMDIREFSKSLTEFTYNHKLNHWFTNKIYAIRNEDTGVGSIPRYYLKYLVDYIRYYGGNAVIHYDTTTDVGRDVELKVNPWWKPREDQIEPIKYLVSSTNHMRALPLTTASGKMLRNGTPIKTLHGWTAIEDLCIGDDVIAVDGSITSVLGVYPQGKQYIYRLTLDDDRYIDCGLAHLWGVYIDNIYRVHTTQELIVLLDTHTVYVPTCGEYGIESYPAIWRHHVVSIVPLHIQEHCTCIAIDHPSKLYVAKDYIVTHNTVMSLLALSQIHKVPMIVLNGLIEQWYKVIVLGNGGRPPLYDIDPDLVYVIKGQDSICHLLDHPAYKPSVVIASISTIRNYISRDTYPYNAMPPFEEFVKQLGIGVKVHDECHQCFSTIMDIDLRANININIYLSATLTRGDKQSRRIFEKVFPSIIQYKGGAIVGHIRTYYLPYNIGYINENKVVTRNYGYNHNRYEMQILKDLYLKIAFTEFIHNCVEAYYIKVKRPGQKCIVLASTVNMCNVLHEYLSEMYPQLKIGLYLGGSDDTVLSIADIIIATVKKGGTGTDIANLKTMINTLSIGSEVLVRQIPGRLRKLPDDTPIYVAMWNTVLESHKRHYRYCRPFYIKYSKEFYDLSDPICQFS